MFQILKDTKFPFMKYRKIAYTFSSLVVLATVAFLLVNRGPRWAVDFTGGTLLQVQTAKPLPADEVRDALNDAGLQGFEGHLVAVEETNGGLVDERGARARVDERALDAEGLVHLAKLAVIGELGWARHVGDGGEQPILDERAQQHVRAEALRMRARLVGQLVSGP